MGRRKRQMIIAPFSQRAASADGALAAKLLKRHILEAGRNLVRCLQQERAIAAAKKQKT